MKMDTMVNFDMCKDLVRSISGSHIISHEALRLMCCEDEASRELLGVDNYSDINLSEGEFISAISCELYDGSCVHILYNFDTIYSVVHQNEDGEILEVKKM